MIPQGVKTSESDRKVSGQYVEPHIRIGIEALKEIQNDGRSVRHLRWE